MTCLNRIRIGDLSLENAFTLEQVEHGDYQLLNSKEVLKDYELIKCANITDIFNGKPILVDSIKDTVAIEYNDDIIAIYKRDRENLFKCDRGLW